MSLMLLAAGLWVLLVLSLAVGWLLTDAQMLSRYESVTGRPISHGSRFAQFARSPMSAIKSVPGDLAGIGEARGSQTGDPILEALRTRSSRLFIATFVVGFGGLPLSFAAVGLLARVNRFVNASAWVHALIIGAWLVLLIAIVRRPDRSRVAVLIAIAGVGISILFALASALDRV